MAKIKNTDDTNCWQDVEQLYLLYFAEGSVKYGTATLGNSLIVFFYKVK